jgi:hypothetical protein
MPALVLFTAAFTLFWIVHISAAVTGLLAATCTLVWAVTFFVIATVTFVTAVLTTAVAFAGT